MPDLVAGQALCLSVVTRTMCGPGPCMASAKVLSVIVPLFGYCGMSDRNIDKIQR